MGKLDYYKKSKISFLGLIILINLIFLFTIHIVMANETRKKINESFNQTIPIKLVYQAYTDLDKYSLNEINEFELYQDLYENEFYNEYLNYYYNSYKEKINPSLNISYLDEITIDNDFFFSSPIFIDDEYKGFINYKTLFDEDNLKDFYINLRQAESLNSLITIIGIQKDNGEFLPTSISAHHDVNEIIIDSNGNKGEEVVSKIVFSYEFENSISSGDAISYQILGLCTPFYYSLSKVLIRSYEPSKPDKYLLKEKESFYKGGGNTWVNTNMKKSSAIFNWTFSRIDANNTAYTNLNQDIFFGYSLYSNVMKNTMYSNIYLDVITLLILVPIYYAIVLILLNKMRNKSNFEQQERFKLTTAVAHELKTPLAIIESYEEALNDNLILLDKKNEYTKVVHEEINHMNELILDFLQLSKIESKDLIYSNVKVILKDIVLSVIDNQKTKINDKNIHININLTDEVIFIDRKLITLVISNLISNAINALNNDGNIYISAVKNKDKSTVTISNDGRKLSSRELETVFNPSVTAQRDEQNTISNTGLGLIVVKAIMRLYTNEYGVNNDNDLVNFWFNIKTN